jgi:hypothetical protein
MSEIKLNIHEYARLKECERAWQEALETVLKYGMTIKNYECGREFVVRRINEMGRDETAKGEV